MKEKKIANHAALLGAAAALVATLAVQSAHAVTYTYTPTNATTDVWSAGTNWDAVPVDAVDTQLTFVDATGATVLGPITNVNTNDISGAFELNILDLGGKGSAAAGEPASITINAASPSTGLSLVSNGATTPVVNLVGANGAGAGSTLTYTVNAPVALTNDTLFVNSPTTGGGTFVFNGVISGSGTLTKNNSASVGTGDLGSTLVLGGDNTFTGNVFIGTLSNLNSGSIRLTSSTALGQVGAAKTIQIGVVGGSGGVQSRGAIELTNNVTIDSSKTIVRGASSGSNAAANAFLRNVSGNNAWNGDIQLRAGGTSYIDSQVAGNTLTLGGNIFNGEAASGTANARTLSFEGPGDHLVSGAIVNGNASNRVTSILKAGTGTLTFPSANAANGVTVNDGTLLVNGTIAAALASGSGSIPAASVRAGNRTALGGTYATTGTLGGTGTIAAPVIIDGTLAPGSATAATGSLGLNSTLRIGSTVSGTSYIGAIDIQLAGTAFTLNATEEYDRVRTAGVTTLSTGLATLNLSLLGTPTFADGDLFGIIDSIGGPVVGTFNGLPEGASIFAGGQEFKITYLGAVTDSAVAFTGGGDVVLQAVPEPTSIALLGLGGMVLGRRRRA